MPKSRPPYPTEFRNKIVELARCGRPIPEIAAQLEPSEQTIRNWIAQADRDQGRRSDGLTSAEREEVTRLRRDHHAAALRPLLRKYHRVMELLFLPTYSPQLARSSGCGNSPVAWQRTTGTSPPSKSSSPRSANASIDGRDRTRRCADYAALLQTLCLGAIASVLAAGAQLAGCLGDSGSPQSAAPTSTTQSSSSATAPATQSTPAAPPPEPSSSSGPVSQPSPTIGLVEGVPSVGPEIVSAQSASASRNSSAPSRNRRPTAVFLSRRRFRAAPRS